MERTESSVDRTSVFERIADGRRRRVLGVLVDRTSPMELDALANRLAGQSDAPETDVDAVRAALVHGHLPALAAVDLVEWDRDGETVTATDHPVLSDPAVRRVLDGSGTEWDAVVDGLADEVRSTVLTVLEGRAEPTPRRALAREVARRRGASEPTQHDVEETLVALHHVHLPKLDRAGLVAYDRDEETVTYRGHPGLEPEWFDARASGSSCTDQRTAD